MHSLLSKLWERHAEAKARAKDDKGFTLIELLVVVVILGVLIAIAIPLYLNYRKGANDAAAQSDLRNAINVLELCNTDNGTYPVGTALVLPPLVAVTGCTRTINLSAGTTLTYTGVTGGSTYKITDSNSQGTPKIYCYNSARGGAVAVVATVADCT